MASAPKIEENTEAVGDTAADTATNDVRDTPEVEALAGQMGWKPRDQFKGDESQWRPASEYILTEREISRTRKDQLKRIEDNMARLNGAHERQMVRALAEQERELRLQHEQAIEDNDKDAVRAAERGLREIERQRNENGPEARFASENPWYNKDEEATAYAVSISQRLAGQGKSVDEQLKAAAEGVRKRFPELFEEGEAEKPKPKPQPGVHAPQGRNPIRGSRQDFETMPAEARAACERNEQLFEKKFGQKPADTRKQFVADYWQNVGGA